MITAAGAGASFCTVTPARLRPRAPKSPRGTQSHQQQQPPLPNQPQVQETPVPGPAPFLHLLLTRTNSAPTSSSPESNFGGNSLDSDDCDSLSQSSRDDTFFGSPQSPTSMTEFLEPPSPKSFYSVATSSSGGTARGISPGTFDTPSYPPLPPPSELHQQSPQRTSNRLHRQRPSSPTQDDLHQSDTFTSDLSSFPIEPTSSAGRNSRRRSKSRELRMHGREICIAVVGCAGVGKSTFIQRALGLNSLPARDSMSSKSILVDKLMTEVKLVELDLAQLDLESQPLVWPKLGDGQRLPFVDGVLILYDVMDRSSLERVPELLDVFNSAALPNLLVSCKCDAPFIMRQIDPQNVEHIGAFGFGGVEAMQTSANAVDSQKKCMATILNMVIARRNEKNSRYLNGRRRANSSATNTSRTTSPRPSTARSGHSRASSEFSAALLKDFPQAPHHGPSHGASVQRLSRSPMGHSLQVSPGQASSQLSIPSDGVFRYAASAPHITLSSSPLLEIVSTSPFSQHMGPRQMGGSHESTTRPRTSSFLDMDDDLSIKDPDDVPILEREGSLSEDIDDDQKPFRSAGFTWDELVDRLLQEKMSRADSNYVTIFLCFYRKIAPPRDLLDSILERFDRAEDQPIALSRINMQLRYCTVLNQWVCDHPGDFAHPRTKQTFSNFLATISKNRTFALLAREMQQNLTKVVEDEDLLWGRSDAELDLECEAVHGFLSTPAVVNPPKTAIETAERTNLRIPQPEARRASDAPSQTSVRTTASMISNPVAPGGGSLLREQYTQFMETSDEEIAAELTRIDWSEFSQIRPRDLVRHVSIPAEQKERCKNLQHVNRMISHFNHIAYWVANMILERPKPKHRGKALEKFIQIAWILRHKNNYNALGAILAGINSTAIHRLVATREFVSQQTQRNFMRLELLMAPHKSHFSYRLALDNTSSQRIPFIPLHRRDLVSADEGNKTFLQDGEKINWNKFHIMGDILMVIIKSQTNPYQTLTRNPTVEKLILDAVICTNDDELYDRSIQLENMGQTARPRAWFRR